MTNAIPHTTTCEDPPSGELPTAEALARILKIVQPVAETEALPLWDAHRRVVAKSVRSPINVPGHTNSAMDGYALSGADLDSTKAVELSVIGRALAGHPFEDTLGAGQCISITTGAPMPAGADTVVMQEYTERDGDLVRIDASRSRQGDNVRRAGEDIREGGVVAEAGTRINPALLGVLASLGLDAVTVYRRPRVAMFSTGDEVQPPGTPLAPGGVYDSNRYTLRGLLDELGLEILDLGLVPDDPKKLRAALARGAAECDAVITSGGVSVGEADYIKPILAELGEVDFWKLAIKPGRPLTFGLLGKTLFFGLPGNPVAVMVTFMQFVQPALERLAGMRPAPAGMLKALCDDRLRKRPGRREFQRGILHVDDQGRLRVGLTGRQGSGILTSMSRANCFIVLPETQGTVEPGEEVLVELLPWARIAEATS